VDHDTQRQPMSALGLYVSCNDSPPAPSLMSTCHNNNTEYSDLANVIKSCCHTSYGSFAVDMTPTTLYSQAQVAPCSYPIAFHPAQPSQASSPQKIPSLCPVTSSPKSKLSTTAIHLLPPTDRLKYMACVCKECLRLNHDDRGTCWECGYKASLK
jgi:hypothetical protein